MENKESFEKNLDNLDMGRDMGNKVIGYIVLVFSILCVFILMCLWISRNYNSYKPTTTRDLVLSDFSLESPDGEITEFRGIKNKSFDELVDYFKEQGYKDVITNTEVSDDTINIFRAVDLMDKFDTSNEYDVVKKMLRGINIEENKEYNFYNGIDEDNVDVSILRNDASDIYLVIIYSKLNNTIGIKPIVGTDKKEENLYKMFDKWKKKRKYKIKDYEYIEIWDYNYEYNYEYDYDYGVLSIHSESDSFSNYDDIMDLELYDGSVQNTNIIYYIRDKKVYY